jgi:hypothetical protein
MANEQWDALKAQAEEAGLGATWQQQFGLALQQQEAAAGLAVERAVERAVREERQRQTEVLKQAVEQERERSELEITNKRGQALTQLMINRQKYERVIADLFTRLERAETSQSQQLTELHVLRYEMLTKAVTRWTSSVGSCRIDAGCALQGTGWRW